MLQVNPLEATAKSRNDMWATATARLLLLQGPERLRRAQEHGGRETETSTAEKGSRPAI